MTGTNPDSEPASLPEKDNWQLLTEKTRLFAGDQVARHYWRGAPGGVLPDGFDGDSIADHVVAEVCQELCQLTDRTPDDSELPALQRDLQRRVRREGRVSALTIDTFVPRAHAVPTAHRISGSNLPRP